LPLPPMQLDESANSILLFVLLQIHEPILVLITIYISIVYGLLYACFELFPIIWSQGYGFNLGESGLIFLGIGLGTTIGAGFVSPFSHCIRRQMMLIVVFMPPFAFLSFVTPLQS
jgi:predicted MFS family arabinose efflux permease